MTASTPDLRKEPRAVRLQTLAAKIVRSWDEVSNDRYAKLVIIAAWFALVVPPALRRGYHYVEGLTVTIAQSAIEDGSWLTPHLYNMRWIERPTLLSWLIAGMSLPFGHVYPFIARLPVILSLLAGCILVWRVVRPMTSSGAALFGAALLLSCPIVIRYYSTAVADVPLAIILFATFIFWWTSYATRQMSLARWMMIGIPLAIAGLLKGPQPLAFFGLGVLAYLVVTRAWRDIPRLAVTGIVAAIPVALWYAYVFVPGDQSEWMRYARVSSATAAHPNPFINGLDFLLEVFPAALLAATLPMSQIQSGKENASRDFILALTCYVSAGTCAVLFWPADVNARYILPMVPPLCVLGAIAYDRVSIERPLLIAGSIAVSMCFLGYAATHSIADLFGKPKYSYTRADGARIAAAVRGAPAPMYRTGWNVGLNELPYVPYRVNIIDPQGIQSLAKPAWIVVPNSDAAAIAKNSKGIRPTLTLSRSTLLRWE